MSQFPPSTPGDLQAGQPVNATTPLILSIVCTVLCCLPLGIVGIVFSAMAMSANGSGEYTKAADLAGKGRLFSLIGIGIGAVFVIGYVLLVVILGVGGAAAAGAAGAGATP